MELPISPYIPYEIILNILSRLPPKSIGQYRCVSKSWQSLLSTPQFIKIHLTHFKKRPQQSHFLITDSRLFSCLILTHAHHLFDEITASANLLKITAFPYRWTDFFGSCNGLLLVGDVKGLCLINPTTREFREVPNSPFAPNPRVSYTIYGLGYDSVNNDYKVVALSYCFNTDDELISDYASMFVHIYSVGNGTWKMCESSPYDLELDVDHKTSGVFVERCIHWVARKITDYSIVIVAFNVEEEKFYEVLPHSSNHEKIWFLYLDVLAGCLCICSNRIDVWVLKEYGDHESWTKLVTFDLEGVEFRPMCLLEQEILVLTKFEELAEYGKLVTYNLKEKTLKDVVVHGMRNDNFTVWGTFTESLVSPCNHVERC